VSYHTQALLGEDVEFGRRSRSCIFEQANANLNNADAGIKAMAQALLKNYPAQTSTFLQAICASPGFATEVDMGDGTIDSSKVTDGELLSTTQQIFPIITPLFYDSTGAPVPV